jgi:hypothetical protein
MIKIVNIILLLCCLISCGNLNLSSISYSQQLEPIYLKNADSFDDNNIIANINKQLRDLNIATTNNSSHAKTIIAISNTQHSTTKIANSSITSDTAYYNNEYSTILNITYPNDKNKNFKHTISSNEQMAILENQNTFNNYYNSAELEKELIERVMLAILAKGQGPD